MIGTESTAQMDTCPEWNVFCEFFLISWTIIFEQEFRNSLNLTALYLHGFYISVKDLIGCYMEGWFVHICVEGEIKAPGFSFGQARFPLLS